MKITAESSTVHTGHPWGSALYQDWHHEEGRKDTERLSLCTWFSIIGILPSSPMQFYTR